MVQLLRDAGIEVRAFTLAAGRLFFKFRNAIFPALFLLVIGTIRPARLFPSPVMDRLAVVFGAGLALLGELIRLTTIGFDYIDRGGKAGRPAASRLVTGGIYAHSRNPMYLGNILIAAGFTVASNSPTAYVTILPFFIFVYHAITCAEEEFLRKEFGPEYEAYSARVPRIFPDLRGLRDTLSRGRYNWRKPLRQDLSTMTWIALMLAAVPLWRAYCLEGNGGAWRKAPGTLRLEAVILGVYGLLVCCKKRKLLFYSAAEKIKGTDQREKTA